MNNIVLIAAAEAESAARDAGPKLEDRLRAAMRKTRGHWCATREDDQILAACEAVARVVSDEDRERIEATLRVHQALSAAASGVPVDFGALLPAEDDDRPKLIPILPLWQEVSEPSGEPE